MAAITVTRLREKITPGRRCVRGQGTFSTTDTSGTLGGLPMGNIVGFNAHSVFPSATAVSYAIDGTPNNGVLSCTGSITVKRSAGTDSAGTFFFELEYDA